MKLLLDHNLPRRLRQHLLGHEVKTTQEMTWEELRNGLLIASAASAGFQGFLTVDKNLEHEQNLSRLPLALIVLDAPTNALPGLLPLVSPLQRLLQSPLEPLLYIVQIDGTVLRLRERRQSKGRS